MTDDNTQPPGVPDWIRDALEVDSTAAGAGSASVPQAPQMPPQAQFPPPQLPPTQLPPTQFPPTQFPPTQLPPTQLPPTQFLPTQFRPPQGQPLQQPPPAQRPQNAQYPQNSQNPQYPQYPQNPQYPHNPQNQRLPYNPQYPAGGQYPGPPQYPAQPSYPGAQLPPQQPGYPQRPPYGAYPQQPGPIIYQPGHPGLPATRKSGAGLVIGIIAIVVVVVLVVSVVVIRGFVGLADTLAQTSQPGDDPIAAPLPTSDPYDPAPPVSPDPTTPPDNTEVEPPTVEDPVKDLDQSERFRAGEFAAKLPKIDKKAKKTAFTSSEYSATEWLYKERDAPKGIKVVFTADPKYNCALEYGYSSTKNSYGVAGCYNSKYYKTLFMWWGTDATDYYKEFILLHEYSHFVQWWDYYDTMQSASQAGIFDKASNRQAIIESDATCRVVYQWGWEEVETSAPCETKKSKWSKWWLNSKVKSKGVTIEDW